MSKQPTKAELLVEIGDLTGRLEVTQKLLKLAREGQEQALMKLSSAQYERAEFRRQRDEARLAPQLSGVE